MLTKPKIKMIFFFSLVAASFLDFFFILICKQYGVTDPGQEDCESEIRVGLTWQHLTDGVSEVSGSDSRKLLLRVAMRPCSVCVDFCGFQQIGCQYIYLRCLILDSVTGDERSETWWFQRCWWRVSKDLKLFPMRGGALILRMDSSSRYLPDLWMVY